MPLILKLTFPPKEESNYSLRNNYSIHFSELLSFSFSIMATMRNKRKLAAVSREIISNRRNDQSGNAFNAWMAEEYITQASEKIERRVTKKLSQEFRRKEPPILGAFSKLDDFFLKLQVWICSLVVPKTSRNHDSQNQEPTGDCS